MADFQDYLDALNKNIITYNSRIDLLDLEENFIKTLPAKITGGSVSDTLQNGSRRNCTIEVENSDGEFDFGAGQNIFLNRKIQVFTAISLKSIGIDEDYFISQGIYRIGEPEETSMKGESVVVLNLYDKFTFLDGTVSGIIQNDFIINAGTSIVSAVQALFDEIGEPKPVIIEPISDVLPYTITRSSGTLGEILIEIADVLSWNVYYDRDGYPRFEPPPDVDKDQSVWDFNISTNKKYIGSRKRIDTTVFYNSVRVVGANINGEIFDSLAEDTNPSSPVSTVNIGKYTNRIDDDNIYNQDLANQRAEYELQNSIAFSESVDITLAPVTHLKSGDIITITDERLGFDKARFLVRSMPIELMQTNALTMKVWRVREI